MRRLLLIFFLVPFIVQAQKNYNAIFTNNKPSIDGIALDECWNNCSIADKFVQILPEPLQASKYNTKIKVCYDNTSIYLLAIMHQPNTPILKQLCDRDRIGNVNVDHVSFYFDTYNDKQNGFAFKVTAAGVQQDERLSNGGSPGGFDSDGADINWDAVWNSAVKIEKDKWVAEIEIPFSAIRIPNAETMDWGFQVRRIVRKTNESSFWNTFDVNQQGFLRQEGILTGIKNIKTPLRLFLYPYLSAGYQSVPTSKGTQNSFLPNGGLDLKYGINDAFTLDMTLIPDFSQVISDNIIRNLSPFEQQLNENRPFFTEGVELFNKQGLFYSRRIGSRPEAYYEVDNIYGEDPNYKIVKNPNVSTLYNSFKVSGRNKKNLGIGIINALQAPMFATIKKISNDSNFSFKTGELTNYNVLVLDKAFKGQNNLNFTNTLVTRANNGRLGDVFGLQGDFYFKNNQYNLFVNYNQSNVLENNKWQFGSFGNAKFAKVSGKYRAGGYITYFSPKFDQSDASIQFDYNNLTQGLRFNIQNNTPKNKKLQNNNWWLNVSGSQNIKPFKDKGTEYEVGTFLLFKNFWDISIYAGGKPFGDRDFYQLARFNLPINNYGYQWIGYNGSSDSRKKFFGYHSFSYGNNYTKKNLNYTDANLGLRYNLSDHLNVETSFSVVLNNASTGRTELYYAIDSAIISFRDVHEYTWDVKLNYNINPNMSINGRFRHYNTFIKNNSFYLGHPTEKWDYQPIAFKNGLDENYNLQNIDLFYNWIFSPGSRFVLSYKQWLPNGYILNNQFQENKFVNNVYETWQANKAWAIAARVIWFLDYNKVKHQLGKKKSITTNNIDKVSSFNNDVNNYRRRFAN